MQTWRLLNKYVVLIVSVWLTSQTFTFILLLVLHKNYVMCKWGRRLVINKVYIVEHKDNLEKLQEGNKEDKIFNQLNPVVDDNMVCVFQPVYDKVDSFSFCCDAPLTGHTWQNVSQICRIYFTCPSGKEPKDNVWKESDPGCNSISGSWFNMYPGSWVTIYVLFWYAFMARGKTKMIFINSKIIYFIH